MTTSLWRQMTPQAARRLATPFILLILIGCRSTPPKESVIAPIASELVLRQDNLAIYQLSCPEFDALPYKLQRYAYHLCRAIMAGRDLIYDQIVPKSLEIRRLLEGLLKRSDLPPGLNQQIRRYAVKFWAANGNYDLQTSRKFIPEFSLEDLASYLDSPTSASLGELSPYIFNEDFLSILVNKNPSQGDAVTESAVNFYDRGITRAQVEAAESRYPLNGRFALAGGQLVEEVYRAGAPDVAPGRMASVIEKMIGELEAALSYAPEDSRPALQALIEYFRTGEPEAFDRHCRLWVKDDSSPVDYIIGFIEVYDDPLGKRGSYEGLVFVEDSTASKALRALAKDAAWFEARMPYDEAFKKTDFLPPTAKAVKVLLAVGDGGPHSPSGINLPNDQRLRETVGTKNFLLTNVMQSGAEERSRILYDEFLLTPEERAKAMESFDARRKVMVALHEIIGHGSGKTSPELKGIPEDYLKEYASTLEEARADLAALWFIGDPHLAEIGAAPPGISRESVYIGLLAGVLINLRNVPEGVQFEEDHARAGHLISSYIIVEGGARIEESNGKHYCRLVNLDLAHQAVGKLLGEIQRIKATGDYAAAKKLVEAYGVKFDPKLRDEVIARARPLDIPDCIAFIMPEIEPVTNKMGGIKDFQLVYPKDFVGQMMRFGEVKQRN